MKEHDWRNIPTDRTSAGRRVAIYECDGCGLDMEILYEEDIKKAAVSRGIELDCNVRVVWEVLNC